ncbi:hypothetical protein [Streptomyces sp. NPDC046821]|uniref:hypothetical protein n=1 Tax=Streptomyces sp. NPDC046821 TaxID=3154702 RepID=UPI0033F41CD5
MAVPAAFAGGPPGGAGITVTVNGSTVQVSTQTCGTGGTVTLLPGGRTSVTRGRQAPLRNGSASFRNVSPGTYTVTVTCTGRRTPAGSQSVTVSSAPTISATSLPARGVQGGLGGGTADHSTLAYGVGGGLVASGVVGGASFLRRRGEHHRT